MPRVICNLENASEEINGWKFVEDRGQMISEELPDEVARRFATIPGYRILHQAPANPPAPETASVPPPADPPAPEVTPPPPPPPPPADPPAPTPRRK